jgi:hypothetical protein
MIQKFLDGKKKYSAFIITVLATLIPMFITEPEAQKTIMDFVPSLAAAGAGVFYILTQGKVDAEKEKVKVAELTNGNGLVSKSPALAVGAVQTAQAQPAQAQAQIPPIAAAPPPFNAKEFHEKVLATVKETYKEQNPCTVLYKARDIGQLTKCVHISQAVDYWNYIVDLAVFAKDWVAEETKKKFGECGYTPEAIGFNQDFAGLMRSANNLSQLATTKIDWRERLAPFNDTLYGVGNLAGQLLEFKSG